MLFYKISNDIIIIMLGFYNFSLSNFEGRRNKIMIIKKIIKEVSLMKLLLIIGMILLYSILSASSSILMTDAISDVLDMNIQNFFNLSIIYIFFG